MYTVGEFSKICQVSVKTLHHYDRIGLLKPFCVDEFTGYRYYTREQVERMLLIGRLKRYGFSLEEVRSILECKDSRVLFSKLQHQKEKLEMQKQETELVIRELSGHLQSFERTGDIMGYQKQYEVRLLEAPERILLSNRQMMGVYEFGKYYSPLFERIAKDPSRRMGSWEQYIMTRNSVGSVRMLNWSSEFGKRRKRTGSWKSSSAP